MNRAELVERIRDRIMGELHVGNLHAGDRLPSVRSVAREVGLNPRTVRAAYQRLEKDGVVELRSRSGVFVTRHQEIADNTSEDVARWLGGVLVESWERRIPAHALPTLLKRCTSSIQLVCCLIETVEDAIVALRYELENDWGFGVICASPELIVQCPERFTHVDFFASTSFNAVSVQPTIERMGIPLIAISVHPGLQRAIRARLEAGRLTIVAVDPRFADRIRLAYAVSDEDRKKIQLVLVDDAAAISRLDPREPVLFTRAASLRLATIAAPTIFRHSPTLSPETAADLATILVSYNSGIARRASRRTTLGVERLTT